MQEEAGVVIIGGGIAGVQAASLLSALPVKLIMDEPYLPYYRMRIGELLAGKEPDSLYMHPEPWYAEKGISLVRGHAISVDASRHEVHLEDGANIPYSKLVIATGSSARRLSLPGGRKKSYVLRTASDAVLLRDDLSTAHSAAIIGGGLLGLEAASAIASLFSIPVSVVESAPYILPRQLDRDSAQLLQEKLSEQGVSIVTEGAAESADDSSLTLKDGRRLDADVLLFSIGVNPAVEIAASSGIAFNRGIIIDRRLRTSAEDVYAIGDAAELDGHTFGLAMHAREMGTAVAKEILGNGSDYVPSESAAMLKVAGADVSSFGVIEGEARVEEKDGARISLFISGGVVRGAVVIGGRSAAASAKAMIGRSI